MSQDKILPYPPSTRVTVKADDPVQLKGLWAGPRHNNVIPTDFSNLESWWKAFTKYHDTK